MTLHPFTPKILHILDHSQPYASGYSFRSYSLLNEQRRRGWQPLALTAPEHGLLLPGAPAQETIGNLRYYRTLPPQSGRFPLAQRGRALARFAARISEVVALEKPDILHVHSPVFNALAALWSKRKCRLPLVYEIRAFWEDASVDHGLYNDGSWQYRLTHRLEMQVCRRANEVAAICAGISERLTAEGIDAGKITIIPNGVDLDRFQPQPADDGEIDRWQLRGKRVVGFIGSFFRYEGLTLLVEAIAQLRAQRDDLVLLLVGDGRMNARLVEQIANLGLQRTVFLTGRVPQERIPAMYALMDVLVYPRYSVPLTERVTPLKPLEAMAMGKALIASDIGGHRELIRDRDTGVLFRAGDRSALCAALAQLLDDPALRRSYQARAAAARERFSWAASVAAYEPMYRRVLAHRRPPGTPEPGQDPC